MRKEKSCSWWKVSLDQWPLNVCFRITRKLKGNEYLAPPQDCQGSTLRVKPRILIIKQVTNLADTKLTRQSFMTTKSKTNWTSCALWCEALKGRTEHQSVVPIAKSCISLNLSTRNYQPNAESEGQAAELLACALQRCRCHKWQNRLRITVPDYVWSWTVSWTRKRNRSSDIIETLGEIQALDFILYQCWIFWIW